VSIDEELRQVIEMLVNKYEVYGVVLFGSRVRGDYKPWSDYDLLIIGSFDKPYPERLEEVMEVLSSTRLHVEPHPYTLGEVSAMLQRRKCANGERAEGGGHSLQDGEAEVVRGSALNCR